MPDQDRRVLRTRNALREALIELITEQGYEKITIRMLVKQANIGYATFFRHYKDKDELLVDVLSTSVEQVRTKIGPGDLGEVSAESGRLIFEHVQQNQSLYRALLGSSSSAITQVHVGEMIIQNFLESYPAAPQQSLPPQIAATHVAAVTIGLIRWWVENDTPYDAVQMGAYYVQLALDPIMPAAQHKSRHSRLK